MKSLLIIILTFSNITIFANHYRGVFGLEFKNKNQTIIEEEQITSSGVYDYYILRKMFTVSKIHNLKVLLPFGGNLSSHFTFKIEEGFNNDYRVTIRKSSDPTWYSSVLRLNNENQYDLKFNMRIGTNTSHHLSGGLFSGGIKGSRSKKAIRIDVNISLAIDKDSQFVLTKGSYKLASGSIPWTQRLLGIKKEDSLEINNNLTDEVLDLFHNPYNNGNSYMAEKKYFYLDGDIVKISDYDTDTQQITLADIHGNIIANQVPRSELKAYGFLNREESKNIFDRAQTTQKATAKILKGEWLCPEMTRGNLTKVLDSPRNLLHIEEIDKVTAQNEISKIFVMDGIKKVFVMNGLGSVYKSKDNFYIVDKRHFVDFLENITTKLPIQYFPAGELGNLKSSDLLRVYTNGNNGYRVCIRDAAL